MAESTPCPICRTTMVLIARQPIDDRHKTLFFKCRLCGKTEQIVVASGMETVTPHLTNDVS
jgi:hypothetical protein